MRRREKRGEGVEESEEKINGEEMRREKERGKRRDISEREEGKVEKQRREDHICFIWPTCTSKCIITSLSSFVLGKVT